MKGNFCCLNGQSYAGFTIQSYSITDLSAFVLLFGTLICETPIVSVFKGKKSTKITKKTSKK